MNLDFEISRVDCIVLDVLWKFMKLIEVNGRFSLRQPYRFLPCHCYQLGSHRGRFFFSCSLDKGIRVFHLG